jgi:hypothetical protein
MSRRIPVTVKLKFTSSMLPNANHVAQRIDRERLGFRPRLEIDAVHPPGVTSAGSTRQVDESYSVGLVLICCIEPVSNRGLDTYPAPARVLG